MVPLTAFAAGGWWAGLSVASVLIAVLAALVVTVITLVNRIELQAASILDSLSATGERTRPLLDLVGAVWSSAVGVFVHNVTAGRQLDQAAQRLRELRS